MSFPHLSPCLCGFAYDVVEGYLCNDVFISISVSFLKTLPEGSCDIVHPYQMCSNKYHIQYCYVLLFLFIFVLLRG